MKRYYISQLKEGIQLDGVPFVVLKKSLGMSKNGKSSLTLTLGDKTGSILARRWDYEGGEVSTGTVYEVSGRVIIYNNNIEIALDRLTPASHFDPRDFIPQSPRDSLALLGELKKKTDEVQDPGIKELLKSFLYDEKFVNKFLLAPAGKVIHHAYIGGLIEHTWEVCRISLVAGEMYPEINKDLLIAGSILHDIGKVEELTYSTQIEYSTKGRLLGHIFIGAIVVNERVRNINNFNPSYLQQLSHIILSHHGDYSTGSPVLPMTLEAETVHRADYLSAQVNRFYNILKDKPEERWIKGDNLLGRQLYKSKVKNLTVEEILMSEIERLEEEEQ
ncbi:MAG TPA: HD domain-containing protein [bacterium]|nr:HD domain-containing protein [bacterium]